MGYIRENWDYDRSVQQLLLDYKTSYIAQTGSGAHPAS
jgi:hypothetical protein